MPRSILIDKSQNRLYLFEDDRRLKTYRVATGKDPYITPEGTFNVVFKTRWPEWTNPRGERIPGGSRRNPLGSRWIGLGVGNTGGRVYGIHGTNRPESIGGYITEGCVRMLNRDVEDLYPLVPIGTPVTIRK